MRRILVLLTVVALLVVMMVVTVAPAFAAKPTVDRGCFVREGLVVIEADRFPERITRLDRNGDNLLCLYVKDNGHGHFTDNNH